jgi:hypothetical protein
MARSGKGPPGGAQTQDNFDSLSHACLSGEIAPAGAPPAAPPNPPRPGAPARNTHNEKREKIKE